MKLTKSKLKQIIKEELENNAPTEPLKEYGGHTPEIYQLKITNELLTKILNVLSQNAAPAEPMD